MPSYVTRLTLAFCLSAACYFATEDWYRRSKVSSTHGTDQVPIAQLQDLTNEVQRKPLTRVIWETISRDEELFAGEAVRTSSSSEAKILFIKTGTVIELEPDSLVVLEESDKGLALDFLKGNLFVKNAGTSGGDQSLTLKSGNSEINLQRADVSLSKTAGDQVDIQVYGGQAQIKQGDKTLTLDQDQAGTLNKGNMEVAKNQLQITSPQAGDPVYIDARKREKITFQWAKISADYQVFVERGGSRSHLVRNRSESTLGNVGSVQISSKVGKFFWRLVAEPQKPGLPTLQSSIIPFSVLPKRPPVQLEPLTQAQLVLESPQEPVRFKWANPAKLEKLMIEIARDPLLREPVAKEPLDDKLGFRDFQLSNSGSYFWRLTGFMNIKGKMTAISSDVQEFQIKVGVELIPPVLRSPTNQQVISYNQVLEKGILLSWDPSPGISNYEITIEKGEAIPRTPASVVNDDGDSASTLKYEPILTHELKSSPARAKDLKPGKYRWAARSISSDGKKSELSPYHHFTIADMPGIQWVHGNDPEQYFYYTSRPSVILQWLKGTNAQVNSWRYRLAHSDSELTSANWKSTTNPQIRSFVDQDGSYVAEVEALNEKNQSIAKSSIKKVTVIPKPLLPGPPFAADLPEELKASRKGDLKINWDPVQGAQKYQVVLKNSSGKIVKKAWAESTASQLDRLKPGQYEVSIQSLDEHDRLGPENVARKLEVPKVSDIAAPKVKTIQVK